MKFTRRVFLASTAALAALSISNLGMGSAKSTSLSKYAKVFKACRGTGMNIFFDIDADNSINYEDMAHDLMAGRPIDKLNSIKHRKKITDALDSLGMSYKIVTTHMLNKWDLEIPTPTGPLYSKILEGEDVVILEDFARAMPIVQTLILQHISTSWRKPKDRQAMFVITGQGPNKIYQQFHLDNPMFNFVLFPTHIAG